VPLSQVHAGIRWLRFSDRNLRLGHLLAKENYLRNLLRSIVAALALTALLVGVGVLSASAGGGKTAKVFSTGGGDKKPACGKGRDDFCTALPNMTVFTNQADNKRNPFEAPSNGRIVAWAIKLGHKPSNKTPSGEPDAKSNLEFFQDNFGNEKYGKGPAARLAILKRQGSGIEFKLADQSPAVKLTGPFFHKETIITLDRPLPIKQGEVVGLTSLTWIPTVLPKDMGGGKAGWRASMKKNVGCTVDDQIAAKAQKKIGSIREYGCKFDARLFYKAYFVPN
jgi:hypothetical protein